LQGVEWNRVGVSIAQAAHQVADDLDWRVSYLITSRVGRLSGRDGIQIPPIKNGIK
jgi:hypothetical protein